MTQHNIIKPFLQLHDASRRLLCDNESHNGRVDSRSKVEALKAILSIIAEVIWLC